MLTDVNQHYKQHEQSTQYTCKYQTQ